MGEAQIPDDVMKVASEIGRSLRWQFLKVTLRRDITVEDVTATFSPEDRRIVDETVARAILADREAQAKRVERMPFQLAQLRHAYMQLKAGQVKNQASFADGLVSPAIAAIEALLAKEGSNAV